jgi:hypothetical protein
MFSGAAFELRIPLPDVVRMETRQPSWRVRAKTCHDLPEHERPARVVFLSQLPTVLGGAKVQRAVLRDQLAAQ